MSKVLVSETNLTAIGNAIREKNGETTLYKPGEMAAAISAITTGGGGDFEIPIITGDCSYRFSKDGWNWFIEEFGDKIETADISNCNYMFHYSNKLTNIPFEINCSATSLHMANIFMECNYLTSVPKINNCRPAEMDSFFKNCYNLREIPEDFCDTWDWSAMDSATSGYSYKRSAQFYGCRSLRSFPMEFLAHYNPYASSGYNIFNNTFYECYVLDEVVDFPIDTAFTTNAITSDLFKSTFNYCSRLKTFTFKKVPTGVQPVQPVKWKSQVIDLSTYVGYAQYSSNITNYGIKYDKEVKDDATYQALKNDPDWFSANISYSRYNHDSAVETINSLPDASSYLYGSSGTNTIKFKGAAGSATDGGAINTLTEEEIAVATARGWTVSLV